MDIHLMVICGNFCVVFSTPQPGNKREARSYFEISQSLGVDNPSQILFITDVLQEAVAAKSAGFRGNNLHSPGERTASCESWFPHYQFLQ
uniref:Enolase-phosphatase E1 n=1 Tax=Aegilops tauschii subsp. strangulata TaxID=200361 RepID=A0A453K1I6_AEGTS